MPRQRYRGHSPHGDSGGVNSPGASTTGGSDRNPLAAVGAEHTMETQLRSELGNTPVQGITTLHLLQPVPGTAKSTKSILPHTELPRVSVSLQTPQLLEKQTVCWATEVKSTTNMSPSYEQLTAMAVTPAGTSANPMPREGLGFGFGQWSGNKRSARSLSLPCHTGTNLVQCCSLPV